MILLYIKIKCLINIKEMNIKGNNPFKFKDNWGGNDIYIILPFDKDSK